MGDAAGRLVRLIATPLARRLAGERSIDLAHVVGTGPRGRIKARDVELASTPSMVEQAAAPAAFERRRPATPAERLRARRLTEVQRLMPHFHVVTEADATFLLRFRDELNAEPEAPRLSLTHLILAAVGRALLVLPDCNSVWDDDAIVTFAATDVGIVVDAPGGLIVPILRDAGRLSLFALTAAARDLVGRARAGRLVRAELEGGVVSVSNVGMHGATLLAPIIAPGQSMMIGVGAVRPMFRPDRNGAPSLRQEIALTLAGDHRVLDGVRGARFLGAIRDIIEHPLRLMGEGRCR
jgi:pyruvate dehydrogenase E2 component (dihydrolipoamide acetyltransferase)